MQSITLTVLRRAYTTHVPNVAAVARTASAPLQVRSRRAAARTKRPLRPGRHDALPSGATPSEHARYERLRALGALTDKDGKIPTEGEWIARLNERRTRIRGIRTVRTADGGEDRIVGQKIYLPNLIFKMVRNHTPHGQPYHPYEATFRISQSLTKTDVRSYLYSVYGVKTTYIRTDNYVAPLWPKKLAYNVITRLSTKLRNRLKSYKRAVVGLVEPFYYPMAPEDMDEKDRIERFKEIEKNYGIEEARKERMKGLLAATRNSTGDSNWRWRGEPTANRGKILQLIAVRRAARESELEKTKRDMLSARASGSTSSSQPTSTTSTL
jgi:large subunit ribosomal protein L23